MARQARPWGYVGLIFTQGLAWTILGAILAPTRLLAGTLVAGYLVLRMGVVGTMGIWGLHDEPLKRRFWLVPLWDAIAFLIWLSSLFWSRVLWRGVEYRVADGKLIPLTTGHKAQSQASVAEGSANREPSFRA
jgi:ceramide glucosyltransferase